MKYVWMVGWFFWTHFLVGQSVDYLSIRDSVLLPVCGDRDSVTLQLERFSLEGIHVGQFNKHQHFYYKDLGWNYYLHFIHFGDTSLLYKAVESFDLSLEFDKNQSAVLWNNAVCCSILGQCNKSQKMLSQYKSVTPKRVWDKDQIRWMQLRCQKSIEYLKD